MIPVFARMNSHSKPEHEMSIAESHQPAPPVTDDRIGKLFVALAGGKQRCLVCERVFNRLEAPAHAQAVCYSPRKSDSQKQ